MFVKYLFLTEPGFLDLFERPAGKVDYLLCFAGKCSKNKCLVIECSPAF